MIVLKNLCKVFKVCKSFIQQKIASKLKKFSNLMKKDPENEKFSKGFAKFEKKLQMVKSLDSKAVKAAAFCYAKFDFKLNFEAIKEQTEQIIEQDMNVLVSEVFEQFEKENEPKKNYLLLYQQMKEKPQARFKEVKEEALKLIKQVKSRKESKLQRMKERKERKKELKSKGNANEGKSEDAQSGSEMEVEKMPQEDEVSQSDKQKENEHGNDAQSQEADDVSVELESGAVATDPVSLDMKKKLADQVDKIIQKGTFYPRNRERPDRPNRNFDGQRRYPMKNDRRKRIDKRQEQRQLQMQRRAAAVKEDHPSYAAKAAVKREQRKGKFEGEIVDL